MGPAATRTKRNDATITQRSNFLEAANATLVGLQDAITKLKLKIIEGVTIPERNAIEVEIGKLEARLAKVQARVMSFLADRASIFPPTAAEVEIFRNLSSELHALVVAATTADAIIRGAARLYTSWNRIA